MRGAQQTLNERINRVVKRCKSKGRESHAPSPEEASRGKVLGCMIRCAFFSAVPTMMYTGFSTPWVWVWPYDRWGRGAFADVPQAELAHWTFALLTALGTGTPGSGHPAAASPGAEPRIPAEGHAGESPLDVQPQLHSLRVRQVGKPPTGA